MKIDFSHTKASHRYQSNNRIFARFRSVCLSWVALPESKPVPEDLETTIALLFGQSIKGLNEWVLNDIQKQQTNHKEDHGNQK